MRVLLVDDHSLFAQSLAIVLSDFPEIQHFSTIKSIRFLYKGIIINHNKNRANLH